MMVELDLAKIPLRDLNWNLHNEPEPHVAIINPAGRHNIAVGADAEMEIAIDGDVGYYCAGMNKKAHVTVRGNAGPGVAENMMSGLVRITGDVSQYAGASGHGGMLVVGGNAGARCGISMKGIDIVVAGDVGHMSGFMAQRGHLIVCGDAGEHLGDSLYEAIVYVRGKVRSLGADCVEKEVSTAHRNELAALLEAAGVAHSVDEFRRFGSARTLYHFNVDNAYAY